MRSFIALALAGAVSAQYNSSADVNFMNYLARFGKSYGTVEEYLFRMELYLAKEAEILAINSKQTSYKVGLNKYSDWTDYEFERLNGHKHTKNPTNYKRLPILGDQRPVDWVANGAVTPVKD